MIDCFFDDFDSYCVPMRQSYDGKVFDSSYKRNQPAEMRTNQVIKGFTEALVHMPAGSVWEVYIPQNLAYGEREAGEIKPFSTLIFNTFNDLFDKKKHIIMTSDRTPQDIDKLEDRLQTRFSSGLVAPISPPDYEICCIILQQRAEKLNITLPKDVVDYIASHINTNVRELEGAFNKLVTFSQIKKQTITLAFTKDALKDQIPLDNRQELTVDFIIDTVCQYYGVKKDKLLGRGRPQKIVIPRQIAMYLCRNELNESYPTLRDYFHRKDHSTVLYACERVEKDIERDPQTRASIEAIRKLLKQRG